MYGYSDEWWVLLFVPVVLWVPFGPFLMAGMGVWCARRPGRWPRLWSVLLPLVPVAVSAVAMTMPLESWDQSGHTEDLLGYVLVYVLGITVLPWVLGYGITRAVRAVRGRREPESETRAEPGPGPGPEGERGPTEP
ncbi:hypothetical protein GCM10018791_57400 [Streptomyces zaomyceticus]|nr:hypothetical protein GCM10018791_57400 [Streptomyces zaomyceticus]